MTEEGVIVGLKSFLSVFFNLHIFVRASYQLLKVTSISSQFMLIVEIEFFTQC